MKETEIIEKINKYWRAANYLTVANMYLSSNKYMSRKIIPTDLKKYPMGHWGTCPGINFIYAHLNNYIKKYHRKIQLVIGPGHGGNALIANLELEQSISESTASFKLHLTKETSIEVCTEFIRTEVNPFMPGTIYDGGELGYSLAVAYGAVMDAPDKMCVCIIGDGEAETGALSASWMCREYMDSSSGFVLPILHLNGLKMGGNSLISTKSNEDIISIFDAIGYAPRIIAENHHIEMLQALEWVEGQYQRIENGFENKMPMLILKSPKGWTAPDSNGFHVEGTLLAHKNPLRNLDIAETVDYLNIWLKSYHPEELFDKNGHPKEIVESNIPENTFCMGRSLSMYDRQKILVPEDEPFYIDIQKKQEYCNVLILGRFLSEIIQMNQDSFRIVSPDELQSNLLGILIEHEVIDSTGSSNKKGRVLEILNENICQAWMQGYIMTGRNCLMVSYEAFMPIITSMVSQYAKWILQLRKVKWRTNMASFTYLITSLCWANTYSHQNPEFVNSLLSSQHDFVRIYLPIDANSLLACMNTCLSTEGNINLIISSKQKMPQWMNMFTAKRAVTEGFFCWNTADQETICNPDIVVAAAGDYPMRECAKAIEILKGFLPDIKIKFISILELTSIGSNALYSHALNKASFCNLFCKQVPVLFCFHGYPTAIRMLLFDRLDYKRLTILGYNNQSFLSNNDEQKMILNGCSRFHIIFEIIKRLLENNVIDKAKYDYIEVKLKAQMERRLCPDDSSGQF